MFQSGLFSDKKVLVTGGGSGIGKAIARQFLELGATVYIASRKLEKLENAQKELSAIGDCRVLELNIRDDEAVQEAAKKLKDDGGIDILINNAGGQFPSAAEMIPPKGWRAVIDTNLNGTWYMTSSFANEIFIPQKHGIVVNIIANIFRGFPGMAHTGAARAGVENLTKSLAVEWAPHHIRINAIAPGIINSTGLDQYPPEFLAGIEAKIPMKRTGSVDEIAYMAVFLATPMTEYMTGQTVYVDGGQSLWGDIWEVPDFK